jgi:hypothetical protein
MSYIPKECKQMWTTGKRVQIQTGKYVSFGRLNGTGMGYSPGTLLFLCQEPPTNAHMSFSYQFYYITLQHRYIKHLYLSLSLSFKSNSYPRNFLSVVNT